MGKTNPFNNQSEQGTPRTSEYGQAFKRAIPSTLNDARVLPRTSYLFRGFIGASAAKAARVITVFNERGYRGELPLDQQPVIDKPLPYKKR